MAGNSSSHLAFPSPPHRSRPLVQPLFAHGPRRVVVPDGDGATSLRRHLEGELAEFDVELGAGVELAEEVSGDGHHLVLRVDAAVAVPRLERVGGDVHAVGSTLDDAALALHLVRTMRRTGATRLEQVPAHSAGEAVARVEAEVGSTWPSFDRTGIDWSELSSSHRPGAELGGAALIPALQRWVAELGDGHTNVHPSSMRAALPYAARAEGRRLVLADVPPGTPLAEAGVGPGDEIHGLDVAQLAPLVGAPPSMRPWAIGRRALSGPPGVPLTFAVRRRDGSTAELEDVPGETTWPDPIEWRRLDTGTGYVRLRRWLDDDDATIDVALSELAACERLLIDLRGNAGGQLTAAVGFRRRFLAERARMGTVRFSIGDGGIGPATDYVDEPSDRTRRTARTRFLTDTLTYSASEDALLGLRQLPWIDVVGRRSGGGSGRVRVVQLLGDAVLTVSTALTYDHDGSCVEGAGIAVDRLLSLDELTPAGQLAAADHGW